MIAALRRPPLHLSLCNENRAHCFRVITAPLSSGATAAAASTNAASPGHAARLANAAGVPLTGNKRVLAYHEPPPAPLLPPSSPPNDAPLRPRRPPLLQRHRLRQVPTRPHHPQTRPGCTGHGRRLLSQPRIVIAQVVGVALGESTYL